jgi:hypothetical protein
MQMMHKSQPPFVVKDGGLLLMNKLCSTMLHLNVQVNSDAKKSGEAKGYSGSLFAEEKTHSVAVMGLSVQS